MMQQFARLALMDEEQTQELKEHSDFTRIEVIKSLGEWPSRMTVYMFSEEKIKQKKKYYVLYKLHLNVMNFLLLFITCI